MTEEKNYPPTSPEAGMSGYPDISIAEPTGKLDDGYELYVSNLRGRKDVERTSEEKAEWERKSKAIARKFDYHLLPMLCFMVGVNYIDKAAIAWAVLFNFEQDLHLKGKEYSWVSSMFYFGYLAGQIPAFYLTARAPLGKVIGVTCIIWGILSLGTMGVKNFSQMMGIRFILGFTEAPLVPCCGLYTALFYTRKENAARALTWGAMQVSLPISRVVRH